MVTFLAFIRAFAPLRGHTFRASWSHDVRWESRLNLTNAALGKFLRLFEACSAVFGLLWFVDVIAGPQSKRRPKERRSRKRRRRKRRPRKRSRRKRTNFEKK